MSIEPQPIPAPALPEGYISIPLREFMAIYAALREFVKRGRERDVALKRAPGRLQLAAERAMQDHRDRRCREKQAEQPPV